MTWKRLLILLLIRKSRKCLNFLVYVLYCLGLRQCLLMRNHTIFSLYFIQWEPENSRIGKLPVDLKYDFENSNEHEKTANGNRHIIIEVLRTGKTTCFLSKYNTHKIVLMSSSCYSVLMV